MSKKNFLLTYSVKPVTSSDEDVADKVRRKIGYISEWTKTPDVETTFTGEVNITYHNESYKIEEARKEVERLFIPILRSEHAGARDVKIYCVMMVDEIGKPFEFVVHQ